MITKDIRIYKKTIFAILINVSLWGLDGKAAEPQIDRRVAAKIAKEKGVLKPKEVLEWKIDQKDIPKDWAKIDNKYFSVSYPKCFNPEGEEGEEDLKITPSILFRRGKDCPGFVNGYGDSNSFNIGYFPTAGIKSIDEALAGDYLLIRQKININDIKGILLGELLDYYNEPKSLYEAQLRWQVYTICGGKTFRIITAAFPGKLTMDLVEKNKYDFPEDFKKIVSTFKCK